jgi:hypothetical protein
MSTCLHDLTASALVASGLAPVTRTTSVTGGTVDLISADGPCFAILHTGAASGEVHLASVIEQSADNATWSAIPGASFATVTGENDLQTIRFTRTARFVRWVGTLTGDTPSVAVSVLIGSQKKSV